MYLTIVISIIVIGVVLLILEAFVLPGFGIAGISGTILTIAGVVLIYMQYGNTIGHIATVTTLAGITLMIYLSVRSKSIDKIALNTQLDGTTHTTLTGQVKVGDTGIAATRLNPTGKVKINSSTFDAQSRTLIAAKSEIEVVRVESTYIIVKPIH